MPRLFALLTADVNRANPNASLLHYSQQVMVSSGPVPLYPVGSPELRQPRPPAPTRRTQGPWIVTEAAAAEVSEHDPEAVLDIFLPILSQGISDDALVRMGIEPPWPLCPHHAPAGPVLRLGKQAGQAWWICPADSQHRVAVGSLGVGEP